MTSLRMKPEEAIRAGLAIHELGTKYAKTNDFEARLPAGALPGLIADIDELRGKASVSGQSVAERKAATAGQQLALKMGAELVSATRAGVKLCYPSDKKIQKLFGVGQKLQSRKVGSVATALQTLIDAVKVDPTSARGIGLLPADTARMAKALSDLVGADKLQEGKKVSAKQSTAARKATQERVEKTIGLIEGVAQVAFVDQPAIATAFREAVIRRTRKAASEPAPKPAPEPKPA